MKEEVKSENRRLLLEEGQKDAENTRSRVNKIFKKFKYS